jgi:hypothetical protein
MEQKLLTLDKLSHYALLGLVGYVAITVQTLQLDVAVLKAASVSTVTRVDVVKVQTEVARHNQWLSRLSDRLHRLENPNEQG